MGLKLDFLEREIKIQIKGLQQESDRIYLHSINKSFKSEAPLRIRDINSELKALYQVLRKISEIKQETHRRAKRGGSNEVSHSKKIPDVPAHLKSKSKK